MERARSGSSATEEVLDALWLSLFSATLAMLVSLVLGVPLAWVLARSTMPGLRLLRALVTLPLVLPPVVGGVALLLVLGRNGLVGQHLDQWFGITIPFTTGAVVIAETFVAMPFLVIAVEGAFRSADQGYDEAAATLGASRLTVFRRVTLPLIRPALVAGAVLCWARALGEFGATITFAGNLQGSRARCRSRSTSRWRPTPTPRSRSSLVLLAVSIAVLFALRGRWVGAVGRVTSDRRRDRSTTSAPTGCTSRAACAAGASSWTSRSRCDRARSSVCSGPTVPASRRCCAPSPVSRS